MAEVPHGGLWTARRLRGDLLGGAALPAIGLLLALGLAAPADAASIQGANGANGANAVGNVSGNGGDGGGNAGSGGLGQTSSNLSYGGIAGTAGTGGGGGGGGQNFPANGGAGGGSEFGTGGLGGTVTRPAGGGGEEAGGGGAFGASSSGSAGGGGGGGGGRGQTISAADGIIELGDTVTGGNGGDGGDGNGAIYADGGGGGGGGIGVVFGGTGLLTVAGSISGGNGGSGGDGVQGNSSVANSYGGSGGAGGTGLRVTAPGGIIVVTGGVAGGDGGAAGIGYDPNKRGSEGVGGVGIIGAGVEIVLEADGSISGGLGGDGTTRANAVTFMGGANSFELQADSSTVVGKVVADGTDDVFRLGGATDGNSFDTTLLGSQYTGFESYEKVGTGTWSLTGTPGVATAWSVTGGRLALPAVMTTDIATSGSGTFALDGGTLDGTLDNGGTTNAHGAITGAITNGATGTFNLDGDLVAGGHLTNDGLFNAFGSGAVQSFAVTGGAGFSSGGTISLSQAGGIAGDVLDLTGAGTFEGGADSELMLDVDLSTSGSMVSDQLLLGATTGTLQVSFNPDLDHYGAVTAGVLVLQTNDGNLQATATGLQDRGLVDYAFEQIGTDWYVTSRLNAAPLGGIVAGMQAVQDIADDMSRPVVFGVAGNPAGACETGVYTSVHGGTVGTTASTTASSGDAQSEVGLNYGGVQADLDFGCFEFGQDATVRLGLVAGFNSGNAEYQQAFAGDTSLHSTTEFETGFAGIYAQLRSGGLIARGQFGYDSTAFDISADVAGGSGTVIDAQHTTAQRLRATGAIGYAFELEDVTLIPTAGLSAAHAETGSIRLLDLGGQIDIADRDAVTVFGGIEVGKTMRFGDGASLRTFGSAMLYEDLGGPQESTYSDDVNGAIKLETTAGGTRGVLSAGVSYQGEAGTSVGLRGELNSSGGEIGGGLKLQAGLAF